MRTETTNYTNFSNYLAYFISEHPHEDAFNPLRFPRFPGDGNPMWMLVICVK